MIKLLFVYLYIYNPYKFKIFNAITRTKLKINVIEHFTIYFSEKVTTVSSNSFGFIIISCNKHLWF